MPAVPIHVGMLTFPRNKHFWNADVGHMELEGHTALGRVANSLNAFILKIHGTTSVASV
jgi:hypothetical protein